MPFLQVPSEALAVGARQGITSANADSRESMRGRMTGKSIAEARASCFGAGG